MTGKRLVLFVVGFLGLAVLWGCSAQPTTTEVSPTPETAEPLSSPSPQPQTEATSTPTEVAAHAAVSPSPMGGPGQGQGQGHQGKGPGGPPEGRGPDNPWRKFHQMTVPEEYASLTHPMPGDEESIARGETLYQSYCASCHGESGLGDGPAASTLTPPPAPLARTAPKLSDGYLYWRIAEGGLQFGTGMPSFRTALTEQDIWDLINFLRSMEAPEDPQAQQRLRDALAQAVEQGVITQEEADLFLQVHDQIEQYRQAHQEELRGQGGDGNMLETVLQALVEAGELTEEQAQTFQDVFQRLSEANLLP